MKVISLSILLLAPVGTGDAADALRVSPLELDFGNRGHGETVPLKLTLENTGKSPLRVEELKPSCGCTKVQPARIPAPLAPGQSVTLTVTMSSGRVFGNLNKYLAIRTENSRNSIKVPTRMTVFPNFEMRPTELKFEGEVGGRPVTETVDVLGKGPTNGNFRFSIEGVVQRVVRRVDVVSGADNERLDRFFDHRVERLPKGFRVHLTLKPTHPEGRLFATLVGKLDGKPLHVPVLGEAFRWLKLSPNYFNFNKVAPSPGTHQQESTLVTIGDRPFNILEVRAEFQRRPDEKLRLDVRNERLDGGKRYRLRAILTVPEGMQLKKNASRFSGKVYVLTDHPEKSQVSFNFFGFFPLRK